MVAGGEGDNLKDLGGRLQKGVEVGPRAHEDGHPVDVEDNVAVAVPLIRRAVHQSLVNVQHKRVLWGATFIHHYYQDQENSKICTGYRLLEAAQISIISGRNL